MNARKAATTLPTRDGLAAARFRPWERAMALKPIATIMAIVASLAGCQEHAKPAPDIRPVRTVTVERRPIEEPFALTGQVRAQDEVSLAFRIDGRMVERHINVGDRVKPGQVLA